MEESCKMNDRVRPFRFLFVWFVAGIAVLPVAGVLSLTAIFAIQTAIVEILDSSRWYYSEDRFFLHIGNVLLITGFWIGALQKGIIRRYLDVEIRRLNLYTALGALLAGIVVFHLIELLRRNGAYGPCCRQYSLSPVLAYALTMAAFAGILSIVQTMTLRRYFRGTWRWVAAHLGAIALASAIVLTGRWGFPFPFDRSDIPVLLALSTASLLTGMVMLRLCRHHRRADKAKPGELAVQPAPVAADSPAAPSVWDDAV